MASEASPSVDTGQVPTQLAILVPTFDPAVDNVEIWASKVELLLATWPTQKITELATRLILGCRGTAYQKLQLHQKDILVNDPKGIRKLVELVGGTWGQIPLEKKYEIVEKAIFRTQQKADESSDSFISRSDVVWTELEAKNIDLSEIRSYILLRGSRLTSDDKKRVLVESGVEGTGALKLPKVVSAIRMLGSGFFQDMVGAKREKGLKTYDHTAYTVEEGSDHEDTFWAYDDNLDDQALENLAGEDDEDAALVLQFEDAVNEVVQNDNELCALYSSYQDARKRLSEKVRFRGFWKVKSSEKGKSKGFKGSKGRGKQSLANRIASSYCRVCLKKGHWKNECPQLRDRSAPGSSSAASSVPTSFVEVHEPSLTVVHETEFPDVLMAEDNHGVGIETFVVGTPSSSPNLKSWPARNKLRELIKIREKKTGKQTMVRISPASESMSPEKKIGKPGHSENLSLQVPSESHETLFASTGTIGVVDIGASQTVIGDKQVPELLSQLPCEIRKQVRQVKCNLVFRFGNHQTLVSKRALLMPLGKVSFRIAIVPGQTPFLLSNSFLKGIKAVIDTDDETLWSKLLNKSLQITRTAKNLFLMDINQLWDTLISEGGDVLSPGHRPQCFASEVLSKSGHVECNHENQKHRIDVDSAPLDLNSQSPKKDPTFGLNNQGPPNNGDRKVPNLKESPALSHSESQSCRDNQQEAICGSKTLAKVSQVIDSTSTHVSVRPPHSIPKRCTGTDHDRADSGRQGDEPPGVSQAQGRVRHGEEGHALYSGLRRPSMDRLVCQDLRVERQTGSCQVRDVCDQEVGPGDCRGSEPGSSQEDTREATHNGFQEEGSNEHQHGTVLGDAIRVGGRHTVCHGLQPEGSGGAHGLHGSGEPAASPAHDQHGDGHPRAGDACEGTDRENGATVKASEWSDDEVKMGDIDYVFHTSEKHDVSYRHQIEKLVEEFHQEFRRIQNQNIHRVHSPQVGLFEVMCHNQSELSRQAEQLGFKSIRFSLETGDLSTIGGRQLLFQKMCVHRPKHLWFSPECRLWCLWSHLNCQKSLALYEKIMTSRWENLWQIALGIVLHQLQVSQSRHFHLEQPMGSSMMKVPGTQSITERTHRCCFDMCKMGNLRDPQSQEFIRKRMIVLTTSQELYRGLHGKLCSSEHSHKQIAGSTRNQGKNVPLSQFTEMYPRKFARQVVKYLQQDHSKPEVVLAIEDDHPTKRRRLSDKMSPAAIEHRFSDVNWQTVMTQVDHVTPRVGTMVIESGTLIEQVRKMCTSHDIKHLVVCRGMDRYVGPNCNLPRGSAPLRRMISLQRKTNELYVDPEWESWEHLSYRGLRRKCVSSRVGLTIFAIAKMPYPSMTVNPSADVTIPTRERPGDTESPDRKKARVATPGESEENQPSDEVLPTTEVPLNSEKEIIDWTSQKHGPKFLQLSSEEQAWLIKIHRNLGHPGSQKLQNCCRQLNCPEHILQAIPELKCSTCVEHQTPHISRSAAIHETLDFGSVVSMDGVTWHNHQGERFHFYHFVDQSTVFQTAVIAPSRTTEQASKALLSGWMLWAGAPKTLVVDAASELNAEEFLNDLQKYGVQCRTCAADAHWQNARAERHGGILQVILSKMDAEEPINDYEKLAVALQHATHTKNQWSRHRGYAPETLVFGKSTHIPGSIVSDPNRATHALALSQLPDGIRFRAELATRERARRAFAVVDNDQVLRRAMVSRSRPNRGTYGKGDWVMIWKKRGEADGTWIGPTQVLAQEADKVVWVSHGTKLYRIAPEHVRYLSASEEWKHRSEPQGIVGTDRYPQGGTQFHNMIQETLRSSQNTGNQGGSEALNPNQLIPNVTDPNSAVTPEEHPSNETPIDEVSVPSDQPDHEPDSPEPHSHLGVAPEVIQPENIPVPDSDPDLFVDCEPCFHLHEDCKWSMEVDITAQDINLWRQETCPHEMALVVSAAKKQRSEVKMSQLTTEEKDLFRQAKDKEVQSWLSTETVCRILRHQVPIENVMRCRWILTWKPIDEVGSQKSPKFAPKARLVVLGYEDPLVHEIPRDSPTMSKLSRMLILQYAASMKWDIESFDIKTAFLRGEENSERILGLEPPAELRDKMKLAPNEILKLLKGAYGRVDAPYLWYMELKKGLEELGFTISPFDPCVFVLQNSKSGLTEGLIGIHVDDGLCCGSAIFHDKIKKLEQKFPFGSRKSRNFTFTGLKIDQQTDGSIWVNQEQYVKDIPAITVSRDRRASPDSVATEPERQSLRGVIGSLQYAATNSRPDLCSRLGMLQSQINRAKVSTLVEANKVLHEAKMFARTTLKIQPIQIDQLRFIAFSDASFASQKVPDSHQGMVIMSCHRLIGENRTSMVNPIVWHSKKIQKVVVSTLSAEAMSLAGAVDILSWVRLYWGWLNNVDLKWKQADETLLKLPPAFAAIPPIEGDQTTATPPDEVQKLLHQLPPSNSSLITTDCKSLYDLISRTAPPSCQEFRTQLQAKLIKEHLRSGIQIRWVPSGAQIADSLTKVMDNFMLRECLHLGKYCLHDETEMLKSRSDARTRLQWLRQNAQNLSMG